MKGNGKSQALWTNPSVSPSPHHPLRCLFQLLRAAQVTRMVRQNCSKRRKSAKDIKAEVNSCFMCAYRKRWSDARKVVRAYATLSGQWKCSESKAHHRNDFLVIVCRTKSQCESRQYLAVKEMLMETLAVANPFLSSPLQCNMQPLPLTELAWNTAPLLLCFSWS